MRSPCVRRLSIIWVVSPASLTAADVGGRVHSHGTRIANKGLQMIRRETVEANMLQRLRSRGRGEQAPASTTLHIEAAAPATTTLPVTTSAAPGGPAAASGTTMPPQPGPTAGANESQSRILHALLLSIVFLCLVLCGIVIRRWRVDQSVQRIRSADSPSDTLRREFHKGRLSTFSADSKVPHFGAAVDAARRQSKYIRESHRPSSINPSNSTSRRGSTHSSASPGRSGSVGKSGSESGGGSGGTSTPRGDPGQTRYSARRLQKSNTQSQTNLSAEGKKLSVEQLSDASVGSAAP